jgi:uncharacterized membrane protein
MFTILGGDGREYGPASAARIQEWIAGGRANLLTKARRAGETEWRTLGDYPEFNPAAADAAPPPLASAAPAPVADAPAATPVRPALPTGTPAEIAAALAGQARRFDVFECLSASFELWKNNFLPLVGVTLVIMLVQLIVGLIPVVSFANNVFFSGVFTGGLHYYYLGKMRGKSNGIEDAFAGFSHALVRLGLTNLLMVALILLLAFPLLAPLCYAFYEAGFFEPNPNPTSLPSLSTVALMLSLAGFLVLLYLSLAWMFAYTLVIDQGLGPWTALEVSRRVINRRWFSMLGLTICAGLLVLLGLLGFFIGILFTIPLGVGATLYAYETLCRLPAAEPASTPAPVAPISPAP